MAEVVSGGRKAINDAQKKRWATVEATKKKWRIITLRRDGLLDGRFGSPRGPTAADRLANRSECIPEATPRLSILSIFPDKHDGGGAKCDTRAHGVRPPRHRCGSDKVKPEWNKDSRYEKRRHVGLHLCEDI